MGEQNKRKMDRYNLSVPAFVFPQIETEADRGAGIELKTRNISSGGAFLITDNPFQIDTEVDLNIRIALFDESSKRVRESNVYVSGSVIRVNTVGMAVKFDKKYQIVPVG